jgi:uncharacterized protein YkwD
MYRIRSQLCLGVSIAVAILVTACGGGGDANDTATSGTNVPGSTASATPVLPSTGIVPLDATTSCGIADFRSAVLQKINAVRAQARICGSQSLPAVGALTWNEKLFSSSARHSADMATQNYFSHTSKDGRTFDQRIKNEGYNWMVAGENIAAGYSTIDIVVTKWLESPSHCVNLMASDYVELGMSCVQKSGTVYGTYWTLDLGRSF